MLRRATDCRGVVRAMHPGEHAVVERLGADREPVDSGLAPFAGGIGCDVFGIRFEGDLGIRSEIDSLADRVQQSAHSVAAETGRSSSAEIQCVDRPIAGVTKAQLELASEPQRVFVRWDDAAYRDRKIAVRAPAGAERDVNVDVSRKHSEIYGRVPRRRPTAPRLNDDEFRPSTRSRWC